MRGGAALLALVLVVAAGGCRITPKEIREIRSENELLRQQIHTMRQNCTYYRELEIKPEMDGEEE